MMKKLLSVIFIVVMMFSITAISLTVDAASKNNVKTSITKVESKAKGFKVTWKKKSKIKGYQIQYSTSSKFKKSSTKTKTISKAKTKSATISKLKGCNKKYYVRVRTYKVSNGKKVYSSWSKTKKVTTLKHKYNKATCTKAKTCKYCKKTSGKKLGHCWKEATCTEGKTCKYCKKTSGKALGHDWRIDDSIEKKTCSRCKKISSLSAISVVKNIIPKGGVYTLRKNHKDIRCIGEGEKFPEKMNVGDYFSYGDYRYEYVCINGIYGWDVYAESITNGQENKAFYNKILLSINEYPIIAMTSTFHSRTNLKISPEIPETVIDMTQTFYGCTSLISAPELPKSLINLAATFCECSSLKTYVGAKSNTSYGDFSDYYIPSRISDDDIRSAFLECPSVTKLPIKKQESTNLPSNPLPSDPQTIRVNGVTLNKTSISLTIGDVQQLTVTVSPASASNKTVVWSSSNTAVAQVSSAGKITAKSKGTAIITVKSNDGNYTASCVITVVEPTFTDVLIIDSIITISNETINTDVYITSTGKATFNNVTVNGNIYCYGQLTASACKANNVYAYAYGSMMSCGAFDGIHGKVSGGISCDRLTILDNALDYAFNKWGKK